MGKKEVFVMKICPNCQTQLGDDAVFCASCGAQVSENVPPNARYAYAPAYDPYDHTKDFDAKDISDNKVIAMLVYLMGVFGIIIALLASSKSEYVMFHVRQALKFMVCNTLLGLLALLLLFTFIVPIVCGIAIAVLSVVQIICFFQICTGKAKEPYIIRNLTFLK